MELRLKKSAALVLIGLACASCSAQAVATNSSTTTTTPNTTLILANDGRVVVALPYLPSEFNPSTPSGENIVTQMVMQQVWPQMFVLGSHNNVIANADLLDSAEVVSLSPQTIVYKLDARARWSDGVPITAADLIYNWQQQLLHGNELPSFAGLAGYQDIASITASNKGKTATVVFDKPYADWQSLFNNLVPAHIAQRYGWSQAFARFDPAKVVSGGPYELAVQRPNRELVLRRNPNYWGQRPRLQQIVFKVEPNDQATLAGLLQGSVDVAELSPTPQIQAALDASLKLRSSTNPGPTLLQLDFNLADPATGQLAIRQAIAAAIDRRQIISNTVGFKTAYDSLVDNRLYLFSAPGSQGNAGSYDQPDLTESAALFSSAGYHLDAEGFLVSALGAPLELTLSGATGDALTQGIEQQIEAQLLLVGVKVNIVNTSSRSLLNTVLPTGSYQLALVPYNAWSYPSSTVALYTNPVGPTPPPSTTAADNSSTVPSTTTAGGAVPAPETLHEPDAPQSGGVTRDVMGFSDARVTSLFDAAIAELNATSQANLYNEIDTQLWAELPTLPLFQTPRMLVSRDDLVNVFESGTWAGPMWNAQNWAIQVNPDPYPTTTTLPGG